MAAPKFRSGIPTRLTSWEKKGLAWGEPTELTGLETFLRSMRDKKIKLVNVVQVMLIRRILPCQRRAFDMWEFDPAEHQMLLELFDMTHKEIWKVLFKTGEVPPPLSEDWGLSATRLASPVSPLVITRCFLSSTFGGGCISHLADRRGVGGDGRADQLSGSIA